MKACCDTQKKRFTILGVEFVYLFLIGIVFAFIGWVAENTAKFCISGVIDSRFHILPFISPYLLVSFAFHIALGSPDDLVFFGKRVFKERTRKTVILSNVIAWLTITFFVLVGELAVGNMWDAFFGVELWNYSKHPLHITQYTSILSFGGFGLGAYLIFKFLYRPLLNLARKKVNYTAAKWIVGILGTLIILDTVRMMLSIIILGEAPNFWRIDLW